MIDQVKYKRQASKQEWIEREDHVHECTGFEHKYVKTFCSKNQFPLLPFCDPHTNPHGVIGLSNHYHM